MRLRASPNRDARPSGARIELLVLHYTGMADGEEALARLVDPSAEVSAHYLIEEDGTLWSLVPEAERAWHAGRSFWRGRERLNDVSIGIELVNPGHAHGLRPFPEAQMRALLELALDLQRRWSLPPRSVVAHSDVAPDRKLDPGERFDWARLARSGLGVWPEAARPLPPDLPEADRMLERIGFRPPSTSAARALAIAAFQRRFRPWRVDGRLDAETMGRLDAIALLLDAAPGVM